MGVTGLWQILQPAARPIKLETLNRKRLAVDASIWIYQFLKAVRDKEGNALRNSHVVGFFSRICKLLFFGIKPVFVFDGGAPALKRQVIRERKRRREGRREDAVRTAGKLLAVQMQRRAEEEEQKRKEDLSRHAQGEEAVPDEGLVYVDELQMSAQERQQARKFRKKDAYHLPDLELSLQEMGQPNDPRIMSLEDLEAYARQFDTGEDINVYDFSKIDYDSPFFMSLPASDRYNILNAARLRSRLRMGHSKEQLDSMFPDRMAFSKFQIERVQERNELTQRLMHLNGPDEDAVFGINGPARVAGEKGREYVLVKNDGVEGGWALGVIGGDEGSKVDKPIDIDQPVVAPKEESDDEEDGFEDIPIEGLNRLPKRQKLHHEGDNASLERQRQALYKSRKSKAKRQRIKPQRPADENPLFVDEDGPTSSENDADFERPDMDEDLFSETQKAADVEEDEELRRAITMSMQPNQTPSPTQRQHSDAKEDGDDADDDVAGVFDQRAVEESVAIPRGSGRAIASIVNQRALKLAPDRHEKFSFGVPVPISRETTMGDSDGLQPASDGHQVSLTSDQNHRNEADSDEEDEVDFRAALAESNTNKRKATTSTHLTTVPETIPVETAQGNSVKHHGFSGPLPFESLDLGSSILGKKKMQQRQEEQAGGFTKPEVERKEERVEPLPPWFSERDLEADLRKQEKAEREDREAFREFQRGFVFDKVTAGGSLRRNETNEVIDLDADDNAPYMDQQHGFVNLEEDRRSDVSELHEDRMGPVLDPQIRMGDIADEVRAQPPSPDSEPLFGKVPTNRDSPKPFEADESGSERKQAEESISHQQPQKQQISDSSSAPRPDDRAGDGAEELEWDASDANASDHVDSEIPESPHTVEAEKRGEDQPSAQNEVSRSPSAEFEDITIPDKPSQSQQDARMESNLYGEDVPDGPVPASGLAHQDSVPDDMAFDDFSDPEDEALLRSLELEAEEHARFASELNNKPQAQNVMDYEKELRQLRNQQKKDRRDADEVTHIMIGECQQLLRLFGLPYVTAPMEAEAQCAELVSLGLVDGIVTDDSDCFLFGGTRIYKNMFNQAKFVECYLSSDLEKEFALTRDRLIGVAHLLGSDYTEGLPGVGPVTALEILSEFNGLDEFKTWWNGVQMSTIPKSEDADKPFRKKFRKNAMKLFLPPTFPDKRVEIAYTNPEVDSDPEPFQWGVPDLDALRSFLMATIGWSQDRTDEVLVPVIRDMNRRADEGTQANITAFFEGGVGVGAAGKGAQAARGEAFAPRKRIDASKRMGSALTRMAERAKVDRKRMAEQAVDGTANDEDGIGAEDSPKADGRKKPRGSSKRKNTTTLIAAEDEVSSHSASDIDGTRSSGKKARPTSRTKKSRSKKVASDA